jgi:hypothetical protein
MEAHRVETSRLPHFLDNRLTDGGELSALHAGYPLPPGRFLVLIFVTWCVDPRAIVWLEGLGQLKNPMASSGIESVTFRLVVMMPQPTTLQRAPHNVVPLVLYTMFICSTVTQT